MGLLRGAIGGRLAAGRPTRPRPLDDASSIPALSCGRSSTASRLLEVLRLLPTLLSEDDHGSRKAIRRQADRTLELAEASALVPYDKVCVVAAYGSPFGSCDPPGTFAAATCVTRGARVSLGPSGAACDGRPGTLPREGDGEIATPDEEAFVVSTVALRVRRISPTIGAEIEGVDLSEADGPTLVAIRQALVDHLVLVIRDQRLDPEDHLAIARSFGELEPPHPVFAHLPEHPQVSVLENRDGAGVDNGEWHTDVTFRAQPALGSLLYARVVPPVGGDTLWANMEAAYEALFVNRSFTTAIDGLSKLESGALLGMLHEHSEQPQFQMRHCWRADDFVVWDNRATQHFAVSDYAPAHRLMHRVTVLGERPVFRAG